MCKGPEMGMSRQVKWFQLKGAGTEGGRGRAGGGESASEDKTGRPRPREGSATFPKDTGKPLEGHEQRKTVF